MNAYTQNTVARIIFVVVPSALQSADVVFVAVKGLFAKWTTFSADVDEDQR